MTLNTSTHLGLVALLSVSGEVFAEQSSQTTAQAEPAGFFLMVLGLVALLLGMRNLRQLRHKRMAPPRLDPVRPPPGNTPPPSTQD